mmetsp:Transcript_47678/g.102109  ORF Transcript_47678/g.102109 Transcript_47678/m.102109 type:complete len:698 (+) Transcript_47678:133-2226(+)|eukprot:CAMPEP_0206446040 /NCGR_PEP_ID=MMETSP0324_2-20121206/15891_1 /ASSEMBLY_ACC=CAM_ASM_000836 /TAXON_ID=2866 /ORGANISM="Crypthecodinium cohnii, Strain Seligo" /LENGTH=697 /DNA_ID=CAMNT_0053914419 /DNA_START=133 /DNA_END=2226 /DNA_ORIENTATION=+
MKGGALRQDTMFVALVASSFLLWNGAAAGQLSTSRGDASSADSFAPALLEFATELKSLVAETSENRRAVDQWCQESQTSKASFAEVLKHEQAAQEATLKQVRLEGARLSHELKLADESRLERRKRLGSAAAAESSSSASLRHEEQELGRASDTIGEANGLLNARPTPSDSDESQSEDSASAGGVAQDSLAERLQATTRLIGKQRTATDSALERAVAVEDAFLQRLNSSVLEADFQVAFLQGEVAHRERRRAQLEARSASTSTILGALLASREKTVEVCQQEGKHAADFSSVIEQEKSLVADLLRILPSAADPSDEAGASFLQLGTSAGAVAYRRFAARQLRGLSQQHPAAERLLEASEQKLLQGLQEMEEADPAAAAAATAALHGDAQAAATIAPRHDALASISSFVGDSSGDLESLSTNTNTTVATSSEHESVEDAEMRRQVNALYANLSQELLVKGEELTETRRHCSLVSRQAKVELSAAQRSAASAKAKLHEATAATTELGERAAKLQAEHSGLEKQLKSFRAAAKTAAKQYKEEGNRLQALSQKLLVAAAQGNQASPSVQKLAQEVEVHRTLLADRSERLRRASMEVAADDELLLAFLKEEARQTSREQRRSANEASLLKGELAGKVDDEKLAQEFQKKSLQQCSPAMMQKLESDTKDLKKLASRMTVLQQNDLDLADDPEAVDAQGLQPLTK